MFDFVRSIYTGGGIYLLLTLAGARKHAIKLNSLEFFSSLY